MFIGNPVVMGSPRWDRSVVDKFPGEHMICDMNGNGLKLSDLKDGMSVKIRAKNIYFPGYEYLSCAGFIAGDIRCKYFIILKRKTKTIYNIITS